MADVARHAGDLAETWHHGGAKYGWSMRLVRKDRNLVHLTPQAGMFLVGVALGEKAIAAAEAAGIVSVRTLEIVAAAPEYGKAAECATRWHRTTTWRWRRSWRGSSSDGDSGDLAGQRP